MTTLLLPCTALKWTSSNGLDAPLLPANACGRPTVTLQTPGERTLTLTATDPQGASSKSEVKINVQVTPALRIVSPQVGSIGGDYCSNTTVTLKGELDGSPTVQANDIVWSWLDSSGKITEIKRGGREVLDTAPWNTGDPYLPVAKLRLEVKSRGLVFEIPLNLEFCPN